jgi:hypothetical protein
MARKPHHSDNYGGSRPGSGRPTKGEVINIRSIMDEHVDVNFVMEKLNERIDAGDQRAIELYLKYRAGQPKQEIDLNHSGATDVNVTLKGLISFDDDE